MWTKLTHSYYQQTDVVALARDLLGKMLYTKIDNKITAWIITETEAYRGYEDCACHSHIKRCTPRTQVMFEDWGHAYVYLCYGVHIMFNIVTNHTDHADAILIRAIHPIIWMDLIQARIGSVWSDIYFINWPGKVTKAMGITRSDYGIDLTWDRIWLEDVWVIVDHNDVSIWPRVWIDYAWDDALLPRRFQLLNSPTTSAKLNI